MLAVWAVAWGLLGGLLGFRTQLLTGWSWPVSAWVTAEVVARCIGVGMLSALAFLAVVLIFGRQVQRWGGRILAVLLPAVLAFAYGAKLEPGYAAAVVFALLAIGCAATPLAIAGHPTTADSGNDLAATEQRPAAVGWEGSGLLAALACGNCYGSPR